jgi:branched-chain amino acid aminotransferase
MPEIPEELFMRCVQKAVNLNAEYCCPHDVSGSLYIRPALFGSSCQIGLDPPDEFTFVVYVQPLIAYHGRKAISAMLAEDFDRAATRGTGSAKVGGNYSPVTRWTQMAQKEGYNVLLHVDSKTQTEIEEFSTSGFIGIRNDEGKATIVLSDSKAIIDSITVDCATKLAESFGWQVEKRPVRKFYVPQIAGARSNAILGESRRVRNVRRGNCGWNGGRACPCPLYLRQINWSEI